MASICTWRESDPPLRIVTSQVSLCPLVNTLDIGNCHSVVGYWDSCPDRRLKSVVQLSAGYHAATTLDHQSIIGYRARKEIKSCNYINNILAKIEAIDAGTHEALMLTIDDYVVECTGDNIFLVRDGLIVATGTSDELRRRYPDEEMLDAGSRVVMPGFVDPHTHLIWAGDRAAEFEMRLEGKSYLEILAAGGGILATVRHTRQASVENLLAETRLRAWEMLRHGTTTAEAKTGYGLETAAELRMLEALLRLDAEGPLELAITFLGAHAVAPEYKGDPDGYTQHVCAAMLPAVHSWWLQHAGGKHLPFVDVFCETGAFNLEQSRRILESAQALGFPLKIHADEFDNLGGASLAAELGAVSADHLVKTSPADIAALGKSSTVAVGLPCTPFGLAEREYTPARAILEAGGLLALASDLNPGTAWCGDMQLTIALACRYMRLTPAQAIAAALETTAMPVNLVTVEMLGGLDVLVVGSPTRGFRPTEGITHLLNALPKSHLAGVRVAAFDTRIWLQTIDSKALRFIVDKGGYAADTIGKALEKKGGVSAIPPEGFLVTGEQGPLMDGELERAAEWARKLV